MRGAREWLLAHLPAGLLSRPDEWLIALLCVLSGTGAVAGVVDVGSVEALLPEAIYRLWGAVLLAGALGLFVGLTSIRRVPNGYIVTRLAGYRLGQRLLFIGGLVYALALFVVVGAPATVVGGLVVAFSLARGVRLLMMGGRHDDQ